MMELWDQVGLIRWPLTFTFMAVVLIGGYAGRRLAARRDTPDLETKAWIDATLFWGAFAFLSGILGTLVGVTQAAQAVEAAGGEVAPSLIWGGLKLTLLSSVLGTVILGIAALIWFGLQFQWRRQAGRIQAAG